MEAQIYTQWSGNFQDHSPTNCVTRTNIFMHLVNYTYRPLLPIHRPQLSFLTMVVIRHSLQLKSSSTAPQSLKSCLSGLRILMALLLRIGVGSATETSVLTQRATERHFRQLWHNIFRGHVFAGPLLQLAHSPAQKDNHSGKSEG